MCILPPVCMSTCSGVCPQSRTPNSGPWVVWPPRAAIIHGVRFFTCFFYWPLVLFLPYVPKRLSGHRSDPTPGPPSNPVKSPGRLGPSVKAVKYTVKLCQRTVRAPGPSSTPSKGERAPGPPSKPSKPSNGRQNADPSPPPTIPPWLKGRPDQSQSAENSARRSAV